MYCKKFLVVWFKFGSTISCGIPLHLGHTASSGFCLLCTIIHIGPYFTLSLFPLCREKQTYSCGHTHTHTHRHTHTHTRMGSHHIEVPPYRSPLPQRGGDFLDQWELSGDDGFLLAAPSETDKGQIQYVYTPC